MGQMNKRALLGRLQKMGQGSRAELARHLGISQPTAGRIVDELLDAQVLEEVSDSRLVAELPRSGSRLGRPSRLLRIDSSHPRFIGMQLGVTETCLAALPLAIGNQDRWHARFATPASAEAWLTELRRAAKSIAARELWGVLMSVPGIVDEQAGRILFSPNVHWTENIDLPALVRQVWDAPVLLVQEERALALGHHAAVPSEESFLLVDFGEGVGGAVVVKGQIYSSPLPIGGELGHTPVLGNWRPCGCGAVGCVETLISTRGLIQSFTLAEPHKPHTWEALVENIHQVGVVGWLAEALAPAAAVIAGAVNVLGVGKVVLTGSVNDLGPAVVTHLSEAVVKGTMWARFGQVECSSAPRRRTAGLVTVGIDRLVSAVSLPDSANLSSSFTGSGQFERTAPLP